MRAGLKQVVGTRVDHFGFRSCDRKAILCDISDCTMCIFEFASSCDPSGSWQILKKNDNPRDPVVAVTLAE